MSCEIKKYHLKRQCGIPFGNKLEGKHELLEYPK